MESCPIAGNQRICTTANRGLDCTDTKELLVLLPHAFPGRYPPALTAYWLRATAPAARGYIFPCCSRCQALFFQTAVISRAVEEDWRADIGAPLVDEAYDPRYVSYIWRVAHQRSVMTDQVSFRSFFISILEHLVWLRCLAYEKKPTVISFKISFLLALMQFILKLLNTPSYQHIFLVVPRHI